MHSPILLCHAFMHNRKYSSEMPWQLRCYVSLESPKTFKNVSSGSSPWICWKEKRHSEPDQLKKEVLPVRRYSSRWGIVGCSRCCQQGALLWWIGQVLSCRNSRIYSHTLKDLCTFGFIVWHWSKNLQPKMLFTSNIIINIILTCDFVSLAFFSVLVTSEISTHGSCLAFLHLNLKSMSHRQQILYKVKFSIKIYNDTWHTSRIWFFSRVK